MFIFLDDFIIIGLNYSLFIGSIILSITSANPIHSILSLINVFLTGSVFLVILNLVFFALIFLAVYLGAIVILFLFIVMMLDIKLTNNTHWLKNDWAFFDILGIFLPLSFCFFEYKNINILNLLTSSINKVQNQTNELFTFDVDFYWYVELLIYSPHIVDIGRFIFDQSMMAFLLCGLLLFIAMIGAIVVTVESLETKFLYQQDTGDQAIRNSNINYYNNLF